jgi:N-acetylmannosamine-6-phosphate 2-epimerase/N-acetylmannosamine kinase
MSLAIDVGGTKTMVALVQNSTVVECLENVTNRNANAAIWCDAIGEMARPWHGRFSSVGAAVTGNIEDGIWTAQNPATLPIDAGFPIAAELRSRLGLPVLCCNDAKAAAWGEYKFGAGQGADMFFLTISTGIGGAAVANGKLLYGRHGHAGSAGQMIQGSQKLEDSCSGLWMAAEAKRLGHNTEAAGIFATDEAWAEKIIATAAQRIVELMFNLHMLFDPPAFIIGGGIGLAPGFLDRLRLGLAKMKPDKRPELRAAALGKFAGVIGVADLAQQESLI